MLVSKFITYDVMYISYLLGDFSIVYYIHILENALINIYNI